MSSNVDKILIIGLGMIGSSIALASKSKGITVYGYDSDNSSISSAIKKNIIDIDIREIEKINSKEFSKKIDLIILAVPPKQTLEVLNDLDLLWNSSITITDTASVKNHIKLDDISNIVLSHPIAGSDKSGLDAADENLFTNKKNILCDPFNADKENLNNYISIKRLNHLIHKSFQIFSLSK